MTASSSSHPPASRFAALRALGNGDLVEYATLQAGLSYLETSFGYWAYRRIGGVDITLGGPVCAIGVMSNRSRGWFRRPCSGWSCWPLSTHAIAVLPW